MRKTDPLVEQQVINLYKEGKSCRDIGKIIGKSETTAFNILKRNNITMRTKGGIDKIDDKEVLDLYLNQNLTLEQIANKYGVVLETIRLILLKNNVERRTMEEYTQPNLNRRFFENIDTEEKAYWLGFMITDGFVAGTRIGMELQKQDEYILHNFLKCLNSNVKIKDKIKENSHTVFFEFHSQTMAQDLAKYGVISNKTWTVYLPDIDLNLMPHLIRGIIDGDGWWSVKIQNNKCNKHIIGYCGNNTIVTQVRDFLVTNLDLNLNPKIGIRNPNTLFSSIQWDNKKDVVTIGDYLYNNATIYLKRKYQKYLEIKNN